MSNTATTIIPIQKTVTATNTAIPRGTRLTLDSSGTVSASAIGVRGDYIALQDIPALGTGVAAVTAAGGSVPVIAAENTTRGSAAYSAATGQVSQTSTNAVLMGKWLQTTSNATLGVIELESVA